MSHHASTLLVRLIIGALVVAIAYIVLVNLIRVLFMRSFAGHMAARQVRAQHPAFVLHLRDLVFKDSFRFMDMLCSKESEWFVRKMWDEVGDQVARTGSIRATPTQGVVPAALEQAHPVRLSSEGMQVERVKMRDGSMLAVVHLPEPLLRGEAYLIGVLLPNDGSLRTDQLRARKLVHFYLLNRWEGDRMTDFCEWTSSGKQLTFNVGAPLDATGFAQTIQAKLDELQARRPVRA